ncbi:hypothetical protein KUF71_025608, partial [Frankliniella fusca]
FFFYQCGPLPRSRFFYTIFIRFGREVELNVHSSLLKCQPKLSTNFEKFRPKILVSMVILDLSRESSVERGADPSPHCCGCSTPRRGAQGRRTKAGDMLIQLMHSSSKNKIWNDTLG